MSGNNVEFGIILKASGGQTVVADAKAAQDGLSGIKNEADKASASADKLSQGIKTVGQYAVAYLGVTQIASFGRAVIDAQVAQDKFNATMTVATGTASAAAAEYEYVRQMSNKLGLEITSTADAYASFIAASRGTSLEGEKARAVFESVSNVSARMSLTVEQNQGVFLALSQMMSKGVVSAEEFRQQLGERLPIATTAGAKALGVTTAEFVNLLNSGKLMSEDFLPKFAVALNQMSGGNGPVDSLQASLNRLSNSFTALRQEIGQQTPIQFVVDGTDAVISNTRAVAAALTGVTVAATAYGSLRLGTMAMDAVAGMRAKSAALVAERIAILEVAQADMAQANAALVAARANNALGTAHAQVTVAETAHAAAATRLAAAQTASAASTGIARGALALVGGPIGAITLALGAGAMAWAYWGNSAKDAANQAVDAVAKARQSAMELGLAEKEVLETKRKEAIAERDRLKATGASTAQIKAQDDIAWAMKSAIETIAIREQNQSKQAQGDSVAWSKMTQTKAQQRESDIADLNAEYLKKVDAQRMGQAEMLKVAEEYRVGLAKINGKYKDKSTPTENKNQTAVDGLEGDAFKKQMESMGVSAAQIKVYELAMNGATTAQIASAQAAATQIESIDAEKKSREGLLKVAEEQAKLDEKLSNDRAGLEAVKAEVQLADPRLQGDTRVEAERAIAIASEEAKYQMQVEAMARENETLTARGQMTEQIAITQGQRMEALTEQHEQRKLLIAQKYMTAKQQFDAMSWNQQVGMVSSQMERMTQVGATKSRAMFELNKLAAKSNAAVSGGQAIMDAYKNGSVWGGPVGGAAMAIIATAETAAILSQINNAQFGGGASTAASVGAAGGIPSQMPNTASPVSMSGGASSQSQAAAVPNVTIEFTLQALEPNSITDETRRKIADSFAPVLQQAFNRNGQVVQVMV
ncbi:MAG: hypothetical protein C0406_00640 [Sideroxydans sp.]|nr:hypothetical protein [Sideroxydans sp.]